LSKHILMVAVLVLSANLGLPGTLRAADTVTVSAVPAGKELNLTLGGLLQAQFDAGDQGDARFPDKNARFYLRRARLNASGKFKEEFEFRFEIDLAGTLAKTTGLRAQLTDGYIFWNHFSALGVRVGQFKTPFGFEQLYGDPRLFTIERTLVNDRLTLGRQPGAQVEGTFLDKRLSYAAATFNGTGANNNFNDNNDLAYAGRLAVKAWHGGSAEHPAGWSLGGDYFSSDDTALAQPAEFGFDSTPATVDRDNLFTGKHAGWGLDSQLQVGPFDFWAEYLRARFEPVSRFPRTRQEADGWYAQAAFYAIPKKLQLVAKYDTFDPRRQVAGDDTQTMTFGANYLVKGDDIKIQVDYLHTDSTRLPKQNKVIARLQVIF
jgi:phosphate-selective porin OprO/OprP